MFYLIRDILVSEKKYLQNGFGHKYVFLEFRFGIYQFILEPHSPFPDIPG